MGKFIKGISGNPSGKPKMSKDIRELAQAYSIEAIHVLIEIARDPDERGSVRVNASEVLLNRAWGMPTIAKDINDNVESTITNMTTNELFVLLEDLRTNDNNDNKILAIPSADQNNIHHIEKA
jgi:hypothetical protein